MNLYQLKSHYLDALTSLTVDEATGEVLGMNALTAIEDSIDAKLLNYGKFIKSLQFEIEAYKQERQRVELEIKRRNSKINALKQAITDNLGTSGKLEDTQCKLFFRKTSRVNVEDEALLPPEFIEYTPKVNKIALKQALNIAPIDGASIEEINHLQIK